MRDMAIRDKLAEAWRILGPAGALGILVLLVGVPFYLAAAQPVKGELDAQRTMAEQVRTRSPVIPVSGGSQGAELQRFYSMFPSAQELPEQLNILYSLAQQSGLELPQADYRLEGRPGGDLAMYRITLPLHAGYPQLRQFIAATLQSMPTASLDALEFQRQKVGEPMLDAQLRLTLYFRPGHESAAP